MSIHDYSPQRALEVLTMKIKERDQSLSHHVQTAINAGKDVSEREPATDRRPPRVYRKTVPFTHEEALRVALDALTAYFIGREENGDRLLF
jgi:hypothetical protein